MSRRLDRFPTCLRYPLVIERRELISQLSSNKRLELVDLNRLWCPHWFILSIEQLQSIFSSLSSMKSQREYIPMKNSKYRCYHVECWTNRHRFYSLGIYASRLLSRMEPNVKLLGQTDSRLQIHIEWSWHRPSGLRQQEAHVKPPIDYLKPKII